MSRAMDFYNKNPEKYRATKRRYRRKLREEIIAAYGGKCSCCGEDTYEFLSIDHVNNNGNHERRKRGSKGGDVGFLLDIRRAGFPSNYQLLCHNCNCAKGWYGVCPHEGVDY